jgi:hypothetical protein
MMIITKDLSLSYTTNISHEFVCSETLPPFCPARCGGVAPKLIFVLSSRTRKKRQSHTKDNNNSSNNNKNSKATRGQKEEDGNV